MIALRINGYCHSCQDFEAEVEKSYHENQCETFVSCRHATKCERIKRHLEKQADESVKETGTDDAHRKDYNTCHTCEYWHANKGCRGTHCDVCANAIEREDWSVKQCRCLLIRLGEPCPYYKKA